MPVSNEPSAKDESINVPIGLPGNLIPCGVDDSDGRGYLPGEDCYRGILWFR